MTDLERVLVAALRESRAREAELAAEVETWQGRCSSDQDNMTRFRRRALDAEAERDGLQQRIDNLLAKHTPDWQYYGDKLINTPEDVHCKGCAVPGLYFVYYRLCPVRAALAGTEDTRPAPSLCECGGVDPGFCDGCSLRPYRHCRCCTGCDHHPAKPGSPDA